MEFELNFITVAIAIMNEVSLTKILVHVRPNGHESSTALLLTVVEGASLQSRDHLKTGQIYDLVFNFSDWLFSCRLLITNNYWLG